MSEMIDNLMRLNEFDQKLRAMRDALEAGPARIRSAEDNLAALRAAIARIVPAAAVGAEINPRANERPGIFDQIDEAGIEVFRRDRLGEKFCDA